MVPPEKDAAADSPTCDPQALVAALEDLHGGPTSGQRCSITVALQSLPADLRGVVENLMDRDDVPAPRVCAALAKHGINVQPANLRRHRKRGTPSGCKCPRTVGAAG